MRTTATRERSPQSTVGIYSLGRNFEKYIETVAYYRVRFARANKRGQEDFSLNEILRFDRNDNAVSSARKRATSAVENNEVIVPFLVQD